jgi:zinc transporter ZupT
MVTDLLLLFITPIIGFFLAISIGGIKKYHYLLLTFSGAYLLSIVFLHILPELYESNASYIGILILLGFFIQVLLDYFSQGIEHGHAHVGGSSSILGVLFGLYFHAFLEGIPLGIIDLDHLNENHSFLMGIILHKLPIAIVLTSLLMVRYKNKKKVFFQILLFASFAPLGFIYGYYFNDILPIRAEHIMALVVGIFIHVGTTIIFESSDTHKINFQKLLAILFGFLLSVVLIEL